MRPVFAVLVALIALPLLAQNSLIDQGRAAMTRGDAETASGLFEKAIAQNPKSADAHYSLGSAYGMMARNASFFSQASLASTTREEFEKAVELDPNHLDAREGLVQFYTMAPAFMGGGHDKALAQAAEIRKRDAMRGHSVTAFIYSAEKKTDEAKKEYADEVKEFPKSPRAHLDFGLFYMGEKNYKAASDEMENAMALDRAFMPPYFRAGQLAVLSNTNLAHGEELLRKYLTYTPKQGEPATARAHYWLGQIFEKQGKKAEAKGQLCGVAQTQPEPEGCHGGAEGFRKAHRS